MTDTQILKANFFNELYGDAEHKLMQQLHNPVFQGTVIDLTGTKKNYGVGYFTTPSLYDLRTRRVKRDTRDLVRKPCSVTVLSGDQYDVLKLIDYNRGATFQVASQFNCLEMKEIKFHPSRGISIYSADPTQGPRCSIACATGTVHRNYTHNHNSDHELYGQINNLSNIQKFIPEIKMQNGYAVLDMTKTEQHLSAEQRDVCLDLLKVGVHTDLPVLYKNATHINYIMRAQEPEKTVHQIFCSSLSFQDKYGDELKTLREKYKNTASLILESTYLSTIYATRKIYEETNNNKLFLTLIGGGAFQNDMTLVMKALNNAVFEASVEHEFNLDIYVVDYTGQNYDMLYPLETETKDGEEIIVGKWSTMYENSKFGLYHPGVAHYYNPLIIKDKPFVGCVLSQAIYNHVLPINGLNHIELLRGIGVPLCLCYIEKDVHSDEQVIKQIPFRYLDEKKVTFNIIVNIIKTIIIAKYNERKVKLPDDKILMENAQTIFSLVYSLGEVRKAVMHGPEINYTMMFDADRREKAQIQHKKAQEAEALIRDKKAREHDLVIQAQVPPTLKTCVACTFDNATFRTNCEMCGTLLLQGGGSYNDYLTNKYSFKKLDAI